MLCLSLQPKIGSNDSPIMSIESSWLNDRLHFNWIPNAYRLSDHQWITEITVNLFWHSSWIRNICSSCIDILYQIVSI